MIKKKTSESMPFVLSYEFSDPNAMDQATDLIEEFLQKFSDTKQNLTVKEMIVAVDAEFYKNLTRGDKCRVGRSFSTLYNQGLIPFLERGEKKG